jgi:hypothetical protein
MAGILTKKFNVEICNKFIDDVESSNNNYYIFVGHSYPWANDTSPPAANLAVSNYDHEVYDNILYGKKVANADVIPVISRYNWTNNTSYSAYNKDDPDLYTKQFFVYNTSASVKSVFKVIQAGTGNSVVAPSIKSTTPFKTSDGYVWKYMYTITDSDLAKFGSNNYLPLTPNSTVTAAAIPGGIDAVAVTSGGAGWVTFNTGFLQSVINSTAMVISSNASSNNDFYVNSAIYFKSGLGSGQIRTVLDYDGASKQLIVTDPLDIKTNLTLANVAGTFAVNDIITQNLTAISITSQSGYIQPGDTITQSNTGATATIVTANSSYLRVKTLTSTEFENNYAIDAGRGTTIGNSTVTTSTSSNTVTATANALFTTFYTTGDYIKVGTHSHRITAIANNRSLTVAGPFSAAYSANAHYKVNSAATVASITNISANGIVAFADVNGAILSIGNTTGSYDLGEIVTQSSTSTNGVISFANSSKLIISSITGSGFVDNATIIGVTSNTSANVTAVASNPTITLSNTAGAFILGAGIISSSSGSANVSTITLLPNEQTEYIISPKVTISGDGTNAAAYSLVNTTTTSISSIVVFDPGSNYTQANATVSANPNFGSNATLNPLISPVLGHGSNAAFELGAEYAGISVTFANSYSEQYNLPGYGEFRTAGLIKDALFDNVYLTINNYDRVKINLTGSNTFSVGEVVYQANLATGIVVYSNTSLVELSNVRGTFDKAAANLTVIGLTTEYTSAIANVNVSQFTVSANSYVRQQNTGAAGTLISANSTTLRLSNVVGTFISGYTVYDSSSNAYANVSAIKTANNTKTLTFDYFNQLARVSLSQLSGSFNVDEQVEMRTSIGTKIGSALVYDIANEVDLIISSNTAAFTINEKINQSTSANGILIGANSTHLKLTNVKGTFTTANVTGVTSGANATVSDVYNVIVLADVDGTLSESTNNYFIGITSSAIGYAENPNTIVRPNLVRDTGSVLYIENLSPVTRTDISTESVKLVIKF